AAGFPEIDVGAPLGLTAGGGDAGVDADRCRVAAGLLRDAAQLVDRRARLLARAVGQRHPAVPPEGDPPQCRLGVAPIPQRHPPRGRPRADPGIVDRVPATVEDEVRLGPQLLHEIDLLLRAAAAIAEILVEADKLDLVPADPDAEAEPAA